LPIEPTKIALMRRRMSAKSVGAAAVRTAALMSTPEFLLRVATGGARPGDLTRSEPNVQDREPAA
jgi:hypothetical protein